MSSPSDLEIQKPEGPELWHAECTKGTAKGPSLWKLHKFHWTRCLTSYLGDNYTSASDSTK